MNAGSWGNAWEMPKDPSVKLFRKKVTSMKKWGNPQKLLNLELWIKATRLREDGIISRQEWKTFWLCPHVLIARAEQTAEVTQALPRNFAYSDLIIKLTSNVHAQIQCHCNFIILWDPLSFHYSAKGLTLPCRSMIWETVWIPLLGKLP